MQTPNDPIASHSDSQKMTDQAPHMSIRSKNQEKRNSNSPKTIFTTKFDNLDCQIQRMCVSKNVGDL